MDESRRLLSEEIRRARAANPTLFATLADRNTLPDYKVFHDAESNPLSVEGQALNKIAGLSQRFTFFLMDYVVRVGVQSVTRILLPQNTL